MAEPRLYLRLQLRHVDRTGERGRKGGRQAEVRLSSTILLSISMTNSIPKQSCKCITEQKEEQNREIATGKCTMNITSAGGAVWVWSGWRMEDKASGRQKPLGKMAQSKLCHYAENFEGV